MPLNILALLTLEAVGLLVAIFIIMNLLQDKNKSVQKRVQNIVAERVETVLAEEIEQLGKEMKKITQLAEKTASETVKKHHQALISETNEQLQEMMSKLDSEFASYTLTQKAAVDAQLEAYKKEQIAAITQQTDAAVNKLLEKKIWRAARSANQHTLSQAALDELLASGELSA